jgi:hypothetical protein
MIPIEKVAADEVQKLLGEHETLGEASWLGKSSCLLL